MLVRLSIENYALIQKLEIDFSQGFSVITGETGAGKSILLGAMALILGNRADSSVLLDKNRKCIVEGIFEISGYHLEQLFISNDIDYEDTAILRREISPAGKSRAFINDTPVNLTLLQDLGDRLVNIHSQHSIVTLNNANFQLAVLDSYAGITQKVIDYHKEYTRFLGLKSDLEILRKQADTAKGERDYHQFLFEELDHAGLRSGEQLEAESRLATLSHAEEIKSNLFRAAEAISGAEGNVLNLLSEAIQSVSAVSKYQGTLIGILERLKSNHIDLKDLNSEISHIGNEIYFDKAEIETLTSRLDLIYKLQKKHQVNSVDELIEKRELVQNKLDNDDNLNEKINQIAAQLIHQQELLQNQADAISKARLKIIPVFEKEIIQSLMKLAMPHAQFRVECVQLEFPGPDGTDKVKFLFSANKGIGLDEITKIASGGELSRLMLSIKSMISQRSLLPTVIFDEIDAGVSGEVAGKVGSILKKLAGKMQVIAITHLPQIAGKGERHYGVYKSYENNITRSFIRELNADERVEELAKMLSDETVTASAYVMAKELLNN
jgi:DNA repair protein RecN (Recombination protein N)